MLRTSSGWNRCSRRAALRLETAYPIPPAAAVRAYAGLARRAGARFELDSAVSLEWSGPTQLGGVVGVRHADGRIQRAGAVLVAAGPWTAAILDPSGGWRPIVRTWGLTVTV